MRDLETIVAQNEETIVAQNEETIVAQNEEIIAAYRAGFDASIDRAAGAFFCPCARRFSCRLPNWRETVQRHLQDVKLGCEGALIKEGRELLADAALQAAARAGRAVEDNKAAGSEGGRTSVLPFG